MNLDKLINMLFDSNEEPPQTRMGTIPADYTGGNPTVLGDGESEPSKIGYKVVQAYSPTDTPAADDRVLLQRQGKQDLIVGKVVDLDAQP